MKVESETYALYYDDETKDLLSLVKVTLTPKENLGYVYFLINGNPENIKVKDYTIKEHDNAVGLILTDLTSVKSIEFLYPEKINPVNLPIYISPEFRDLEFEPVHKFPMVALPVDPQGLYS